METRPILDERGLRRLPFQRWPVAGPGTTLVYELADGRLVVPEPPHALGGAWWNGPRRVYVVDDHPHRESFACDLPSAGDVPRFHATVTYAWRVNEPVQVVHRLVENPVADCRAYLMRVLPSITRRYHADQATEAETDVGHVLGVGPFVLEGRAIRIDLVHTRLWADDPRRAAARR